MSDIPFTPEQKRRIAEVTNELLNSPDSLSPEEEFAERAGRYRAALIDRRIPPNLADQLVILWQQWILRPDRRAGQYAI